MADIGFEGQLDRILKQPMPPRLRYRPPRQPPQTLDAAIQRIGGLETQLVEVTQALEDYHERQQRVLTDAHDHITRRVNEMVQTSATADRPTENIENLIHWSDTTHDPVIGMYFNDGTQWHYVGGPYGVNMFILDVAAATVTATTTETTVFSETIPGNAMHPDGFARLTGLFEFTNNAGSAQTLDIRLDHGGALRGRVTFADVGSSTAIRTLMVRAYVIGIAASSQRIYMEAMLGQAAGITPSSAAVVDYQLSQDGGAIDMTADSTLALTVQHGSNDSSVTTVCRSVHVEIAP